ncbi:MAG: ferredoxin [Sulfuricurvum sp. PC08-66]|nr:MAG: ferredoxin [Sulfuricurvum sp. PC08-66]
MISFKKRSRNDLLGWPVVGLFFHNRYVIFAVRLLVLGLFGYGIYLGLVVPDKSNSYTPALFWGLFWSLFIVVSLSTLGRVFCGICPHAWIGQYLTRWGLKMTMPNWMQNRYIGIMLLFIGWWATYYAYSQWLKTPFATALFFAIMTGVAWLFFFLYKDMSYCKSLCPIGSMMRAFGRMSFGWLGTYKEECTSCKTFSCASACPSNLKPFTFDTKKSMGDCTLCMECTTACEGVNFRLVAPSSSLFSKFTYAKVEVWVYMLITAAIPLSMGFHHALGRTSIAESFIWSQSAQWVSARIDVGSMDIVGLFAFIYATIFAIGSVYIGMFLASKALRVGFEKTFYTLGYAFAPLFLIGGMSHLLETFFLHKYSDIANGFIYGFGLPWESVMPLAARGDTWLHLFKVLPYIATAWAVAILVKRAGMLTQSRWRKSVAVVLGGSLIWLYIGTTLYTGYVFKTYGASKTHAHATHTLSHAK